MPFDAHSPHPLTGAAAVALIDTWDDLPCPVRRKWCSAVRGLSRALQIPLEAMPMDPALLNPMLRKATAAKAGVSDPSFRTYKTMVRQVMRRLGVLPACKPVLTPDWQALFDAVPSYFMQMALRRMLAFISSLGLTPEQVDESIILAYREYLHTQVLRRQPNGAVRRVAWAWNDAIGKVPGWPQVRLELPDARVRYALRLRAYPASLQAEVRALAARLSGENQKGLYTGDGPPRPLSPNTVKARLHHLELAAIALVERGRDPASLTSLAMLVEEEALKTILDFHYERLGERRTSHLGGIASALMIVARYHCRLPPEQLARLRALAKCAMPPRRSTMTEKNASRLNRLDDAAIEARLLLLPTALMREARRLRAKEKPRQTSWTAAVAVAVQILLICPLRAKNLVNLRLDANLVRLGKKDRITHLRIPGKDVKNQQPIEWLVPPDIADFIQGYLDDFRPTLPYTDNAWLFPGRDHGDKPRNQAGLAIAISHVIRKHVGIEMHTHLFRAYAAKVLLEEEPDAIDDLRQLLGHKGLETTLAYYVHFRGKAISKRFNAIMFGKQRQARRLLAVARRPARNAS